MKEKMTLAQRLADELRRSVTKVDPRAKKELKAYFKARGMGKKENRTSTRKAVSHARPIPPEERTLMDKTIRLAKIGNQLRITK